MNFLTTPESLLNVSTHQFISKPRTVHPLAVECWDYRDGWDRASPTTMTVWQQTGEKTHSVIYLQCPRRGHPEKSVACLQEADSFSGRHFLNGLIHNTFSGWREGRLQGEEQLVERNGGGQLAPPVWRACSHLNHWKSEWGLSSWTSLVKQWGPFREKPPNSFEKAGGSEKWERGVGDISGRQMKR